jgi:hypothetical protein
MSNSFRVKLIEESKDITGIHALIGRDSPNFPSCHIDRITFTLAALFTLHMRRCLSSKFFYQFRQFDQIGVAEQRPPRRNRDEWIDAAGIRAARQNRLQPLFGIVEIDSVLAPVLAIVHKFILPPEERVEGMDYAEMFLRTVITGCS